MFFLIGRRGSGKTKYLLDILADAYSIEID
jgi:hypothetical protein